ncbi:ribonuclease H-like domain-containing protein [Tanacetum coccineum]
MGIFIMRDSSGISQRKYATKILERAHMVHCIPSRTPIDTESKLGVDGDPAFKRQPTLRQSIVVLPTLLLRPVGCEICYVSCIHLCLLLHLFTVILSVPIIFHLIQFNNIHFVRDLVDAGQVCVIRVPSRYEYADIFTKGLPSALFEEFRTSLSVLCSFAETTREC